MVFGKHQDAEHGEVPRAAERLYQRLAAPSELGREDRSQGFHDPVADGFQGGKAKGGLEVVEQGDGVGDGVDAQGEEKLGKAGRGDGTGDGLPARGVAEKGVAGGEKLCQRACHHGVVRGAGGQRAVAFSQRVLHGLDHPRVDQTRHLGPGGQEGEQRGDGRGGDHGGHHGEGEGAGSQMGHSFRDQIGFVAQQPCQAFWAVGVEKRRAYQRVLGDLLHDQREGPQP